jgi:molybdopterin synthase sulfur carrier subunit
MKAVEGMDVEVRLFHGLNRYLAHGDGEYSQRLEIMSGTTAGQVLKDLGLAEKEGVVIFVNGRNVEWEYVLKPGDILAAMRPAGGG